MIQWVKDLALSLLWHRFDPWPGNFHVPQAEPKKNPKHTAHWVRDHLRGAGEGKVCPALGTLHTHP